MMRLGYRILIMHNLFMLISSTLWYVLSSRNKIVSGKRCLKSEYLIPIPVSLQNSYVNLNKSFNLPQPHLQSKDNNIRIVSKSL